MKGVQHSGEALALLILLEGLQSETDATRQDDLFKGVKGKHSDAWNGEGEVLTLWRDQSFNEDAGTSA